MQSAPLHPVVSSWRLKCVPAQLQRPCSTSFLLSSGPPCSGTSIHVLSFIVASSGCTSPLGRVSSCLSPSHSGILTTDLALSYSGASRRHPGSSNAPDSMHQALQWQQFSFTFAGVNVCGFNLLCIGVRPCMQTHNGQVSGLPGKTSESQLTLPLISGSFAGKTCGFALPWTPHSKMLIGL